MRVCGSRSRYDRPREALPRTCRKKPVPLQASPVNRGGVELIPFVGLPGQVNVTLFGRRIVVIGDYIDESLSLMIRIEFGRSATTPLDQSIMKPSVCGTSLMSTPAPAHTSKFLRDSVSVISIGVVRLAPLMMILSVSPFADSEAGKINVARRVSAAAKCLFTMASYRSNYTLRSYASPGVWPCEPSDGVVNLSLPL
jgi:hypothetical protein